ncbi:Serine carboxypeptidase [Roseimaritima multifibrata]|uniref:Serine carboxypeptidase n=1 Tax=Roseimaritima multifibrata TaxID=1930274 RepID=A0A517MBU4_9BACT|nr:peptidase S10 [Roseimaritima multifibrata]QDS92247.1 Serine carboxypeptidase [Roseimaritima multifibrata]
MFRFAALMSLALVGSSFLPCPQSVAVAADEKASKQEADKEGKAEREKEAVAEPSVTQGTATIGGKKIDYTATAGKMLMKDDAGEAKAEVFFVAYTVEAADGAKRPITFCFNGGPGSSSVWLHLGMLGPRRVKLNDDAKPIRPPHELIENPYSLLDKTDLVFIDPVSTGFSRPAKGQNKNQFHGFDEDVRSVGQFIHDFTTKYGRWGSPKFLLGESYGGLRAAGLSSELQGRYHMYLNGIVLISAVVDFQTLSAKGNNDIAYALFLPSFAATAWYHKALPESLQNQKVEEVVAQAEAFAREPYLQALLAGDSLSTEKRDEVIARMAELTGLSADYIDRANLRVNMGRFGKELLRDRRQVVGRFDGRYTGVDLDHVGERTGHDPSGSAVFGPFTSAMNQYLRDDLKVEEDRVYEILTGKVHPWDYSEFTNRYVDASSKLRDAIADNPYLRIFAACGYYDLATPSFAMEYTRDHLGLPVELRENFTMEFYDAGHMMYVHEPSLIKLREDLLKFYDTTLADAPAVKKE